MVFQASRFHHHIVVSVTWSFRWLLRRISWKFSTFVAAGGLRMTKTVGWCRSLASSALASILNLQSKKSTGCYWFVMFLLLSSSALDRARSLSLFCSTRTQSRAQLNYQSIMLEVYQVHSFFLHNYPEIYSIWFSSLHRVWEVFLLCQCKCDVWCIQLWRWPKLARSEAEKNAVFGFFCVVMMNRSKPIQLIKCVKELLRDWIIACLY